MSTSITVLTPAGRRQVVKVTPNTSILQILEDVCKKQGFSSSDFDLRHHKTVLDTSNTVRFSNLPNNAQLEMVKASRVKLESEVTIGLQLPSNERVMRSFETQDTLWDVLVGVQTERNEIITQSQDDDGNILEPVCVYMRREVVGEEQLKSTTLRSLGLTGGKAVIRLFYRIANTIVEQPHVEAIVFPKPATETEDWDADVASTSRGTRHAFQDFGTLPAESWDDDDYQPFTIGAGTSHWNAPDAEDPVQAGASLPMPTESETPTLHEPKPSIVSNCSSTEIDISSIEARSAMQVSEESIDRPIDVLEEKLIYLDDKGSLLYCLDQVDAPVSVELPDSYFEVTVSDIKLLFSDLKKRREELEDGGTLKTQSMRESECLLRLNRYPKAVIRVVFPDRLVLQGHFRAISTVEEIYKFVRSFLADGQCDFHLFTAPPKKILDPENRLFEIPLVPAAIVYFGCETRQGHYLSDSVLEKISSPRAVQRNSSILRASTMTTTQNIGFDEPNRSTSIPSLPSTSSSYSSESRPPSNAPANSGQASTGAVPKWFSVGKK